MVRATLRRPRLFSSAILAVLLFTVLPGQPLAAAVDPAPKVDTEQMREHLDRLDKVLDQRLKRLERLPAEKRPSDAERQEYTAGLRRHLRALEAMVRRAKPAGADELLHRIRGLERRVGELERWPEADAPAATAPASAPLGQAVSGVDSALDLGGTVAGTVTQEENGEPIFGVGIHVWDSAGTRLGFETTDGAGHYSVTMLPAGSYFVTTDSSGYLDELYDDRPCPEGGYDCNPTTGTPVAVEPNTTTSGIDFALHSFGAISGTVTEAATSDAIPYVSVEIYRQNGSYLQQVTANGEGRYTFSGLTAGTYFVRINDYGSRYLGELYDDLPCSMGCDVTTGTPIVVHLDETVSGIDFALRRLGVITGAVTESATDAPISNVTVYLQNEAGDFFADTEAFDGSYRLEGILPGNYFLNTNSYSYNFDSYSYLDELYDDFPCPQGQCDRESGTPVPADIGEITSDIDFELDAAPTISGRVTSTSGTDLAGFTVRAYDENGTLQVTTITDNMGKFTLRLGIATTYYIKTDGFDFPSDSQAIYRDELYDDIPCHGFEGCDPTSGTPIAVGPGEDVSGIDFELLQLGSITGRVIDSHGDLVYLYFVSLWNAAGELVEELFQVEEPRYYFHGLEPGTYYVTTRSDHADELFDDLPCEGQASPACDPTAGTPITVSLGTTVSGVNFALVPPGSISGRVFDQVTGEPALAVLTIWAESGEYLNSETVIGDYTTDFLAAGSYFLTVAQDPYTTGLEYLSELYDDLPCRWGECDPTLGTPVVVSNDVQTTGIDFALAPGGKIIGRVTDTLGQPLSVELRAWDESGRDVYGFGNVYSDSLGQFTLSGLETGRYYVATDSFTGYRNELYADVPCASVCQPNGGTLIAVTAGTTTADIDFELTPIGSCVATGDNLCLNDDRFRITLIWSDFEQQGGRAAGEHLTDDSGYFYFLDSANVEVVVKVLRACFGATPRYWVFAGGLTNVEVEMTVTDTVTGQSHRYDNPLGTAFELVRDTETFISCDVGLTETETLTTELTPAALQALTGMEAVTPAEKMGTCVQSSTTLCLGNGRFAVTADWADATAAPTSATAEPLTADTGYFTFLDPNNVEVVIKVLNACGLDPFHNFWVFAAGLTDLDVELQVTDTVSGEVQSYTNALGDAFVPVQDTTHFATCP